MLGEKIVVTEAHQLLVVHVDLWYCFVDTEDVSTVTEVVSVSQSWNVRVACGLTGFDVENVYCCT